MMYFLLQILQTILIVSIIVIGAYLAGNLLGKQSGYRWRKILWLILAIRLLIPLPLQAGNFIQSFEGIQLTFNLPKTSVTTPIADVNPMLQGTAKPSPNVASDSDTNADSNVKPATDEGQNNPIEDSDVRTENYQVSDGTAARTDSAISAKLSSFLNALSIVEIIVFLWAVSAAGVLLFRALQYRHMKKQFFAQSVSYDGPLSDMVSVLKEEFGIRQEIPVRMMNDTGHGTPMLFGYFHTTLFLPNADYNEEEMTAILRHELTHYRSRDLWYKLVIMVSCDIYWFNPIFRLMRRMAFYDIECVCDEKATKGMNSMKKKDYCNIILKTVSRQVAHSVTFSTQFGGAKKNVKKRFDNIFSSHNRMAGISMFALLMGVMVFGTACVSMDVNQDNGSSTQSTQASSENETTNGGKIVLDAYMISPDNQSLINDFKAKYPDYEITVLEDEYYNIEAVEEQGLTAFWSIDSNLSALAGQKKIADITSILEKRGWLDQISDTFKKTVTDENGKIYGIPRAHYAYGLYANTELFKEAGLTDESGVPILPQTMEELAETAVKIKEATGKAGLCLATGDDYFGALEFCNIAYNFGATNLGSYETDGSYHTNLDSENAIQAMEFVKDLKWKYDVLTDEPEKENYTTSLEHFAAGTAAMTISGSDVTSQLTGLGMSADVIALGAIPAGPNGDQHSIYSGDVLVFSPNATEDEIDAVLTLLEMQGAGPVLNDAYKATMQERLQQKPTLPEIPVWNNSELRDYELKSITDSGNTNMALFQTFYDKISTPDNVKSEVSVRTADLYFELTKVLKAVTSDPDADVAALMKTANENWQKLVDMAE